MFKELLNDIEEELMVLEEDLLKTINTKRMLIRKPLENMINAGGKRLRPGLVLTAARFGNYDFEKARPLALAVELLHMASMIHDDIVDDSPTRRGIPSIQSAIGKDAAVYAGDYVFCKVFEILANEPAYVMKETSKAMSQVCEGEIKQKEDFFNVDLTLKDYLYRIEKKTAVLFALSAKLGAFSSQAPCKTAKQLYTYGINAGMAFQMADDLSDFIADSEKLGKPKGSDLKSGVITLPVIYALKKNGENQYLRSILETRNIGEGEFSEIVRIIEIAGGFVYTKNMINRYVKKAQEALMALPDVPAREILNASAKIIIENVNKTI